MLRRGVMALVTAFHQFRGGEGADECAAVVKHQQWPATYEISSKTDILKAGICSFGVGIIAGMIMMCILYCKYGSGKDKKDEQPKEDEQPKKNERPRGLHKATQSQVTYKRKWATPRFHVLPQESTGVFEMYGMN